MLRLAMKRVTRAAARPAVVEACGVRSALQVMASAWNLKNSIVCTAGR